jgi:hypothetical protein
VVSKDTPIQVILHRQLADFSPAQLLCLLALGASVREVFLPLIWITELRDPPGALTRLVSYLLGYGLRAIRRASEDCLASFCLGPAAITYTMNESQSLFPCSTDPQFLFDLTSHIISG